MTNTLFTHLTQPGVIDADSQPFKSKWFMPVFSDLRYLVVTEPVQDLIAHNLEYSNSFAVICQLSMRIHPNKRAVTRMSSTKVT